MAVPTQRELVAQQVAQLRLIDPGASAEVGTPERKILDAVSQSLADAYTDLNVVSGAIDLDSKFGTALDAYLQIFGFARQKATYATGFVVFSRSVESLSDIIVPSGTIVRAPAVTGTVESTSLSGASFYTTQSVILPAGDLEVVVPIRSTVAGAASNVATGRITEIAGSETIGVTAVRNDAPTLGGSAVENDNEFKVRFKNTVFRNLAGTTDQYTALAVATAFTTRANVVGPISRYIELIQIPPVQDNWAYSVDGGPDESGNGAVGEYTTALSTIPHSKHVYDDVPYFVGDGQSGALATYYRPDVDFKLNTTEEDKDRGDTYRFHEVDPAIGLEVTDDAAQNQPNITFLNVYTGTDEDVTAPRPGDVVLFEHSYLSKASRNDAERNITNAVDVFIDGSNISVASSVIARPNTSTMFVSDPTSKFYDKNYRRAGQPLIPPVLGNILTPLFRQPVIDLPDEIVVEVVDEVYTYTKDVHYWMVEDTSELGGTVRARNGIEWSMTVGAQATSDEDEGPFTGPLITALSSGTSITIGDYTFDKNILDLQASLERNKQVTTDILAHRAKTRYFKFDVTVMLGQGASVSESATFINDAVGRYLNGLYFGSAVQLSDILDVIHGAGAVDNVRWSSDIPDNDDLARVFETDWLGRPLLNVNSATVVEGSGAVNEVQRLVVAGEPTGGTYTLTYTAGPTAPIAYNANAATLKSAINAVHSSLINTITGTGTIDDPFLITFTSTGAKTLITGTPSLTGGPTVLYNDFFVADDEIVSLPQVAYEGDTAPGLIIRQRAQHTWGRL